ncbi:hypothetical protein [Roseinatronobacter monicus]|uniref:Uncharacterized protein n=1 Tax=Roseinatronobacter monicus TaxID=393481 RepID=A0A543KIF3_9RHOB|nr:hypothetical protein [Roseinatronobacter monicus]TQM94866.1 hypothetical protein BD293_3556 [Roseinatronobacter monicus]
MAHFAEIDSSNVVCRVLVVPDAQQHRGEAYLRDDLGLSGRWVQTTQLRQLFGKFVVLTMGRPNKIRGLSCGKGDYSGFAVVAICFHNRY